VSSSKRALVADDDAGSREATSALLRAEGYTVASARSGREALERAGEEADVVLLDATLPDVTGLEVLAQLRSAAPATPVIMMSAERYVDTVVEALRLGAVDFLQKPLERDDLLRAIGHAVASACGGPGPVDYDACLGAARAAIRGRLLDEARALLHRAIGHDPGRPEAFNLLGAVVASGGDPYRAQDFFRAAISVDATYGPAQRNLSRDVVREPGKLELGDEHADGARRE